jgi:hypothetical protein
MKKLKEFDTALCTCLAIVAVKEERRSGRSKRRRR